MYCSGTGTETICWYIINIYHIVLNFIRALKRVTAEGCHLAKA